MQCSLICFITIKLIVDTRLIRISGFCTYDNVISMTYVITLLTFVSYLTQIYLSFAF